MLLFKDVVQLKLFSETRIAKYLRGCGTIRVNTVLILGLISSPLNEITVCCYHERWQKLKTLLTNNQSWLLTMTYVVPYVQVLDHCKALGLVIPSVSCNFH